MEVKPEGQATVAHSYSRGVDIFVTAAQSFGFNPSAMQISEWQDLLGAARLLDDLLDSDNPQLDREKAYDAHVSAMFEVPDDGASILNPSLFSTLRSHSERWSDGKAERVRSLTANVRDIASTKRLLSSAKELGAVALQEGTETARLFEIDSPSSSAEQSFNTWLDRLLRFGVVIDTALDLPEDYQNGLTLVSPTLLNRGFVALCGRADLIGLATKTPAKLYWMLVKAAGAVIDDVGKDAILREK